MDDNDYGTRSRISDFISLFFQRETERGDILYTTVPFDVQQPVRSLRGKTVRKRGDGGCRVDDTLGLSHGGRCVASVDTSAAVGERTLRARRSRTGKTTPPPTHNAITRSSTPPLIPSPTRFVFLLPRFPTNNVG